MTARSTCTIHSVQNRSGIRIERAPELRKRVGCPHLLPGAPPIGLAPIASEMTIPTTISLTVEPGRQSDRLFAVFYEQRSSGHGRDLHAEACVPCRRIRSIEPQVSISCLDTHREALRGFFKPYSFKQVPKTATVDCE